MGSIQPLRYEPSTTLRVSSSLTAGAVVLSSLTSSANAEARARVDRSAPTA